MRGTKMNETQSCPSGKYSPVYIKENEISSGKEDHGKPHKKLGLIWALKKGKISKCRAKEKPMESR